MNYIIVGLGNPGQEYEDTRHNTGWMAVDALVKRISAKGGSASGGGAEEWKEDKKIKSETAKAKIGKNTALLIKPKTFMNKSGDAVRSLVKTKKVAETLVVVHDDMDIPFGKIKLSFNKSSGGHRGVESIIKAVKTEGFIRMRVGICPTTASGKLKKPQGEEAVIKLILDKIKAKDLDDWKKIMKRAGEGLELIVSEGKDKAMGYINSL
ncbi:MAG: aminoacyl-tRNA hydrolase [Candidatus Paceibacterota bacterium]|jgi:PTH1 family peptidyl-tRNA hydrolase